MKMDDGFLVPLVIFATVGWVCWTISTNVRRSHAARAVAELHSKLLDKCAASQDLMAYIESDTGRKFLESASTENANPTGRILNAIQAGAIALFIGIAELLVRVTVLNTDTDRFLLVSGAIALAIGIGFLISAAMSFVLCKSWGLLNPAQLKR
jgi:ABC-type multidrug transport system fused ATPase/permease subunit